MPKTTKLKTTVKKEKQPVKKIRASVRTSNVKSVVADFSPRKSISKSVVADFSPRKSISKSVVADFPARRSPGKRDEGGSPRKPAGLTAQVLDTTGKESGNMTLPGELFAAPVNKQLLAQSVRVYLANQRVGHASTKTRGQVEGSTRKIYKQKGTGRARHGGIRAPVFVGGGIAFGPKPQDHSLIMPKKMRHVALASALSLKLSNGNIQFVDGFLDEPSKTKRMGQIFDALGATGRTLFVVSANADSVTRAVRNLAHVDICGAKSVNPYALLSHPRIVMMKESVPEITQTFIQKNPS